MEWGHCHGEGCGCDDVAAVSVHLDVIYVVMCNDKIGCSTLSHCSPSDPLALWMEFHDKICDDLRYALEHRNLRVDPTQEDVFDYGLYLIDRILQSTNQSLHDWAMLPFPVGNWAELC